VARRAGGAALLRIEDLDIPRVVAGAEAAIERDLRWLGLDWDETPVRQSERLERYEEAIERLHARGLVYPCDCSRADIARLASAPHAGEETPYPGTCRRSDPERPMKRAPSLRIRVPDELVTYEDGALGRVSQNLAREVGDFVLRRGDGVFAYQLAVVVDDLAMGITDVVRGADLVPSTPRQCWLAQELGGVPPRYTHVPLVVAPEGTRLEKRTPASTLRELREAGVTPERVIGRLARGLGLVDDEVPRAPWEVALASGTESIGWPRDAWRLPREW
jgi:glutamyl-tRNA synthetase